MFVFMFYLGFPKYNSLQYWCFYDSYGVLYVTCCYLSVVICMTRYLNIGHSFDTCTCIY